MWGVNNNDSTADDLLPLPPATFHILLSLAVEDRHGYAIIQDVAARTGGAVKLSAGTLYSAVRRMLEQGKHPQWVEAQLGHADLELTITVYGAWSDDAMRAEASRV